jgi:hypothetical protein
MNRRLGFETGKPLADARRFAEELHAVPRAGEQPPLVLAALRKKMVALAGDGADRAALPPQLSKIAKSSSKA